jgi:hypothetical protein
MKVIIWALSAAVVSVGVSGCATITRGTTTDFSVESTPPGASVKTSTGFSCDATPCSMKMPRKEAFDATVSKAGYAPVTMHVDSKVSDGGAAGFAGNAVAGGLIGMGIDATSGAMDSLTPNPLKVTLVSVDTPPSAAIPVPDATATPAPTATPSPAAPDATPPAPAPAPASIAPASTTANP